MSKQTSKSPSKEQLIRSLQQRATELWGPKRAEALRSTIEQTATNLLRVAGDPPPADEEPGFYL